MAKPARVSYTSSYIVPAQQIPHLQHLEPAHPCTAALNQEGYYTWA